MLQTLHAPNVEDITLCPGHKRRDLASLDDLVPLSRTMEKFLEAANWKSLESAVLNMDQNPALEMSYYEQTPAKSLRRLRLELLQHPTNEMLSYFLELFTPTLPLQDLTSVDVRVDSNRQADTILLRIWEFVSTLPALKTVTLEEVCADDSFEGLLVTLFPRCTGDLGQVPDPDPFPALQELTLRRVNLHTPFTHHKPASGLQHLVDFLRSP